jgi:formylglycine-generating enzyme required for sulfatase activity
LVTGNAVSGDLFYRSYDGVVGAPFDYTSKAYPATVSNFLLDRYEITVGRFRKFVAAYSQSMIAAGAGKNPNNPSDPGWDTAWNANLPPLISDLTGTSHVQCSATGQTWTPSAGANENKPMNCLDWYEAYAFCIWDGGRLPTEAEWNYAAAGGTEQRVYPWGAADPNCTYANFQSDTGYCVGTGSTNNVGSESPKGDGRYGQADLGGNVIEWVLDWGRDPYPTPCTNCAVTTVAVDPTRVQRGGAYPYAGTSLTASGRIALGPGFSLDTDGARCARTP